MLLKMGTTRLKSGVLFGGLVNRSPFSTHCQWANQSKSNFVFACCHNIDLGNPCGVIGTKKAQVVL